MFGQKLVFVVAVWGFSFGAWADKKYGDCGSSKWQRMAIKDVWGKANFGRACRRHDRCYGKCPSDKYKCDSEFKSDLKRTCTNAYSGLFDVLKREGCKAVADVYHYAVDEFGEKSFQRAQRKCP